jgi:actin-related protein
MKDKEKYWIHKKDWDEVGPRVLDQIKDKLTV